MCPSSADSGTFLTLIRTVSGLNLRISRILRMQSNLPTTQSSLDLDLLFMLSESLGLFVPLYTQLEYRYMMVWFIIYIVYSGRHFPFFEVLSSISTIGSVFHTSHLLNYHLNQFMIRGPSGTYCSWIYNYRGNQFYHH